MRNKLNKIYVAVFLVACCLVFFVLQGEEAFASSTETPSATLASVPELFYICFSEESIRLNRIRNYIRLSRLDLGRFDPEIIKASWTPEDADIIDELILSSKQALAERTVEMRALREVKINNYVLTEDFPEEKIKIFHNFIVYSAPCPIVDARLGLNDKVSYEDFLSAVSMALAIWENYLSNHAIPFAEKVLEPLSHDLRVRDFRGYRFPVEDLPAFFRRRAAGVQSILYSFPRMSGISSLASTPNEICMARHYARTFWAIYRGRPLRAYGQLIHCIRHHFIRIGYRYRHERPYYAYSDEERHQWFLFLQAELRHAGYNTFARQILETELAHYRELIVWQLQKRAYMAQRLYENRDSASLSILEKLLMQELTDLRSNDSFNLNFEKVLDKLRAIDNQVRIQSQSCATKGIIVLPWINRRSIDRRMGRCTFSEHQRHLTATREELQLIKEVMEEDNIVDYETKTAMRTVHEWILCYIRALAIVNERLYVAKNLKELTQLHSVLVNNKNVSYTEIDTHLLRRRPINEEQRRFNIRRFIIIRHFWNHQRRRENGDMTVGEIILPWVEVRDEWFESGDTSYERTTENANEE